MKRSELREIIKEELDRGGEVIQIYDKDKKKRVEVEISGKDVKSFLKILENNNVKYDFAFPF